MIHLVWIGGSPRAEIGEQVSRCLASVLRYAPEVELRLHTDAQIPGDLVGVDVVPIGDDQVWAGTPLAGREKALGLDLTKPESCAFWVDVFRVATLWRHGGTYMDLDDVMIRPVPPGHRNVLAAALVDSKLAGMLHSIRFRMERLRLISARCCPGSVRPFRFGNDPMVAFDRQNPFLWRWLEEIARTLDSPHTWGQIAPTRIFASDTVRWAEHVRPVAWHDLLYHSYSFGHAIADKRYPGRRIKCSDLDLEGTKSAALLDHYGFFAVKVKSAQTGLWRADGDTVVARLVDAALGQS